MEVGALLSWPPNDQVREPNRVITVRLPKSLHEALRTQAHSKEMSLNQLCITKLREGCPGRIQDVGMVFDPQPCGAS